MPTTDPSAEPSLEPTLEPMESPTVDPEPTLEALLEARAAEAGFLYDVANGVAKITGYTGTEASLEVPAALGGYPVVEIHAWAFYNNKTLTSVVLPDSVKTIGEGAFTNCSNLRSVSLGGGLTSIGVQAFVLTNITSIAIPDSVETIGRIAFTRCDSLVSVSIGSGIESIGESAFAECGQLSSITLPDKAISYGDYVFQKCQSLKGTAFLPSAMKEIPKGIFNKAGILSITWPSGVTSIGESAFADCKITQAHIPSTVKTISRAAFAECAELTEASLPTGLTSVGISLFAGCSKLSALVLPDDMTEIPEFMFNGTAIRTLALPDHVTKLKDYAFKDCASLVSVDLNKVQSLGYGAFYGCSKLQSIDIPATITALQPYTFGECAALSSVTIRAQNLSMMGEFLFSGCKSLTSYTLPTSVNTVSYGMFTRSGLKSITLHEGVTEIDDCAFQEAAALATVDFPDSLQTIGDSAFASTGLTSLHIGSNVRSIGGYAFLSCPITKLIIDEGVKTIGNSAFMSMKQLKEANLPRSVESIGDGVFSNCAKLKTVRLGSQIREIPSNAFSGCTALTEINLDKITRIGEWAFRFSGLEQLTIPANVEVIAWGAFSDSDQLMDVVIKAAPSIDGMAFSGCENLVSVDLGSMAYVSLYCFDGCKTLMSVKIPDTCKEIDSYAFRYCDALSTITIPKSVTKIGSDTFESCDNLIIYCTANSEAHRYAYYNGIPFVLTDSASDFKFVVYKKQIILLAYTGKAETVNIPSKIGKYPVTVIGENAFYGNSRVKQINVPSSVKEIDFAAFMRCTALTGVSLPSGLGKLGALSFALCPKLERITMPAGLTALEGSTFAGCTGLNSVVLPGKLKKIGAYDFASCLKLKELIIPESVSQIDVHAFASTGVTLVVVEGSATESFAKAQGIAYRQLRKAKITVNARDGSVSGAGEYLEGKTVTLKAKANKGYEFLYWLVAANQVKGTTYTFVANQDQTIEAVFDWAGKTVVKLDKTSSKLEPGETCKLTPSILPRKRASQNIVWKSSDIMIARVQGGQVTAVKNGTVTISATATDGSKSGAKCVVTVRTLADSISVTGNKVLSYKQTAALKASLSPETTSDKRVSWSSSDTKVATVSSDGRVTARKVATATPVIITATARDGSGCTFDYPMTVVPPAAKVNIAPSGTQTIDLTVRPHLQLSASVSPADAMDDVKWTSSNTKVASVDAAGLVTGKRPGSVSITATAKDGSKAYARVKLNVAKLVASVTITGDNRIVTGRSTTLKPVYTPADATNRTVSWKSDNPLVSVNSKGVVTVKKGMLVGTIAKITATCKDAGGASGVYNVIVSPPAASIILSGFAAQPVAMKVKGTLQLTADVDPDGALQRVIWSSSSTKTATVSATGLVTAQRAGTVTITAKTADGGKINATLKIVITQ